MCVVRMVEGASSSGSGFFVESADFCWSHGGAGNPIRTWRDCLTLTSIENLNVLSEMTNVRLHAKSAIVVGL